ncbi:hypothetical protein ACIBCT_35800 [Streptosporangium sp. NPDC050855]|uniref:hypothetical protein n=1 Tax=Streptosporangium sp. NPDC050855 TaxID=3366194 RepID=UPI0037958AD6
MSIDLPRGSGYTFLSQTVPAWAVTTSISGTPFPTTWAIKMTVPAGMSVSSAQVAIVRKPGAAGRVRSVFYAFPDEPGDWQAFPVAASLWREIPEPGAGWVALKYPSSVPARDQDWHGWVMLEFADLPELPHVILPVARPYTWDERHSGYDVYSSVDSATVPLPPYLDLSDLTPQMSIPMVGIS